MSVIAFSSAVGPVPLDVILSERHGSSIEITGNPIETGAEVNDHAYVKPKELTLEVADRSAAASHAALVSLQEAREPFTIVSGLRVYTNMLIQSIDADRDKDTSRILRARVSCREVIIVSTSSATSPTGASQDRSRAAPGSSGARRAATPSRDLSSGSAAADRASGTLQRGDSVTSTVPAPRNQSILRQVF